MTSFLNKLKLVFHSSVNDTEGKNAAIWHSERFEMSSKMAAPRLYH